MASDMVHLSGISGRYATALFELARDAGTIEETVESVNSLSAMLSKSEDFRRFTASGLLSRTQKAEAALALAGKAGLSNLVTRFLGVVADNGRFEYLPSILDTFNRIVSNHKGELSVHVSSAHPLTKKQRDALVKKLKLATGQDIQMAEKVDQGLIGGLVVKIGSRMVDSSIKTKLANLKVAMKGVQ